LTSRKSNPYGAPPANSFDCTISVECFEHNPFWLETFVNMLRMTREDRPSLLEGIAALARRSAFAIVRLVPPMNSTRRGLLAAPVA